EPERGEHETQVHPPPPGTRARGAPARERMRTHRPARSERMLPATASAQRVVTDNLMAHSCHACHTARVSRAGASDGGSAPCSLVTPTLGSSESFVHPEAAGTPAT